MSNAWSWYVIILTLANVFGCIWLIRWTSKPIVGEAKTGEVTGHTWDETLQEYNNPLPRWWLWMFYFTIVFGLIYLALYPALGNFKGLYGWSSKQEYEKEIAQANAAVARAMTILSRKGILVGGVVAKVNPDKCAVCVTCVRTCPYGAPSIGDEGHAGRTYGT